MASPYDVAIIGAGPGGATCAWYLARAGLRVLLLEKRAFPRDKTCGDAICSRAQLHLERMGVLREVLENGEGHPAAIGGMVSPGGVVAIGDSAGHIRSSPVIAIRRMDLDNRIARAAERAGAELIENCDITGATLADGTWTLSARGGVAFQARTLVAADGALSGIARRLGLVATGPDAICSRAYIDADGGDFAYDGVAFYPRDLLPGYCAVFREARDQLIFCLYIIPGGTSGTQDVRRMHDHVLAHDPFVSRAVGPGARVGRMQGAPLRLGGAGRSFADRLLVIGDAAGQIDPLTGEGIQYAMDAAEIAAETLTACLRDGNAGAARLARYEARWRAAFGNDFAWSARIARLYTRHPSLLDAGALALQRGGAPLLAQWAEIMTGAQPKLNFLRPRLAFPVLGGMLRNRFRRPGMEAGLARFRP